MPSGELIVAYARGWPAQYPGKVHAPARQPRARGTSVGPAHREVCPPTRVALLEHILGAREHPAHEGASSTRSTSRRSAGAGAIFTHGAPPPPRSSRSPTSKLPDLSCAHYASPLDVLDTPVIGKVLWARSATGGRGTQVPQGPPRARCRSSGHDRHPRGLRDDRRPSRSSCPRALGLYDPEQGLPVAGSRRPLQGPSAT
jgi:hypothetical protein